MKTLDIQGETIDQVGAVIRRSSLFKGLSDEQLHQSVAQAALLQIEPGEYLIEQGKPPAGFFVILEGEMRVMMAVQAGGDPVEVTRFGRGEMLGLTSLLLGSASEAGIEATKHSTVVSFNTRFFDVMVERVPSLASLWRGRWPNGWPCWPYGCRSQRPIPILRRRMKRWSCFHANS